jgi:hypothetical protein
MINANQVKPIERDGIAAAELFWVQVSDGNVLNDDVLGSSTEAETFALDTTRASNCHDSLVRSNIDGRASCLVPSSSDCWRSTAVVLDDLLTSTSGSSVLT